MKHILRNYFKLPLYLVVLIGFGAAQAGSFEDYFSAIQRGDARTVSQLLARGFDVNTTDAQGQHGLYLAFRATAPAVSQVLLKAPKLDVNALTPKGESALMMACIQGELELVDALIKKGADVNKTGWTPLHYAASTGQVNVIKLLIEEHAYIDAESPNGSTPLMLASMYGSPESVRLLLDEGADPGLKNQQGLTALEFAQRASRPDAIEMMTKALRQQRATGKW